MKNIIITISFLFWVVSVFGQNTIRIKKTAKDSLIAKYAINLIGKWKLDSAQYREYLNVKVNKQTLEIEGTKGGTLQKKVTYFETYEFFDNNTYKYEYRSYNLADDGFTQKGKWNCENGKLFLRRNKEKSWSSAYTIEKMTPKKCVLSQGRDASVGEAVEGFHEVGYYIRIE